MRQSMIRFGSTAAVALLTAAGCMQNERSADVPRQSGSPTAASMRTAADDLPLGISAAIRQEHPNAGVTNVTRLSAETDEPLWRVTYIENGAPASTTYFIDGRKLPNPTPSDTPAATTPPTGAR